MDGSKRQVADVFTISPRTRAVEQYWPDIRETIRLSHRSQFTGVLLFTGNDTYVDPWMIAQAVCQESDRLCPLVAVNPVYMHPFAAAKMVSSLAHLFGRKTYLNMVTGTAKSHLVALADSLDHDARYERLLEYGTIIERLTSDRGTVDFSGTFYSVEGLQLLPPLRPELQPEFYVAGASDAANRVAAALGAVQMSMASPEDTDKSRDPLAPLQGAGVHLGMVVRETTSAAWDARRDLFPESAEGRLVQEMSMRNTDSVWKHRMFADARAEVEDVDSITLMPFRVFGADCPYFVGSVDGASELIRAYLRRGAGSFIIDLPPDEISYDFAEEAFAIAFAGANL